GEVEFLAQAAVVGAAAHGEVVACDEDFAPVDGGAAADHVGRGQADQPAFGVVLGEAGGRADLVEAARVDQGVEALAHGQLAVGMMPGHLLGAAHLPGEFLPTGVLVDLLLPAHPASCLHRVAASRRAYDTSLPGLPPRRRRCPVSPRTSRRCTRTDPSSIASPPPGATASPRSSASSRTWRRPPRYARRSSPPGFRWCSSTPRRVMPRRASVGSPRCPVERPPFAKHSTRRSTMPGWRAAP